MTSSTAASSQHLDRHPCPGTEACLGSRLHFQRQPHTAIWDCFLSAGFPDVCLNLTSPNSNTEKRKGHPAHLSRAAVTQRAPEPVPPRAGCSHHTTEQPLEWNAPGGHHLLPGSHPSSSCAAPTPTPFLSFSSFPPPRPPSHPFLLASVLSFHEQRVSRLGAQPAHVDKDSDLRGRRHLPCRPHGQHQRPRPWLLPRFWGRGGRCSLM